jgi:hypothetical protein
MEDADVSSGITNIADWNFADFNRYYQLINKTKFVKIGDTSSPYYWETVPATGSPDATTSNNAYNNLIDGNESTFATTEEACKPIGIKYNEHPSSAVMSAKIYSFNNSAGDTPSYKKIKSIAMQSWKTIDNGGDNIVMKAGYNTDKVSASTPTTPGFAGTIHTFFCDDTTTNYATMLSAVNTNNQLDLTIEKA